MASGRLHVAAADEQCRLSVGRKLKAIAERADQVHAIADGKSAHPISADPDHAMNDIEFDSAIAAIASPRQRERSAKHRQRRLHLATSQIPSGFFRTAGVIEFRIVNIQIAAGNLHELARIRGGKIGDV